MAENGERAGTKSAGSLCREVDLISELPENISAEKAEDILWDFFSLMGDTNLK